MTPTSISPSPGELAYDARAKRLGVVMDTIAGLVYLRPPHGGTEWTTRPQDISPPPPAPSPA
ncbi:hypothetical protein [Streptomyces rubellomurinus]|uniref:hypothetical protein n=1 Tax=Streptomyces rubellomurinus (strain ATCC 31215) TaxID=359131 RepID=UPI000698DE8F|nr:hypothetical protein [Streptomyces rubellomurinus]